MISKLPTYPYRIYIKTQWNIWINNVFSFQWGLSSVSHWNFKVKYFHLQFLDSKVLVFAGQLFWGSLDKISYPKIVSLSHPHWGSPSNILFSGFFRKFMKKFRNFKKHWTFHIFQSLWQKYNRNRTKFIVLFRGLLAKKPLNNQKSELRTCEAP